MAKFGFMQEAPNAYSGPIVYEIRSDETVTLYAPENPIIMERARTNLRWLHWEEQFTKRVVVSRKLTLSPPHPDHQAWWMNYSPSPTPPKVPWLGILGPLASGSALSAASAAGWRKK